MLELLKPTPCLYFASVIYDTNKYSQDEVIAVWRERFQFSGVFVPEFSPSLDYYAKEMGSSIKRIIVFDLNKSDRDQYVDHKLWATQLEAKTAKDKKRSLNIDIGQVCLDQMSLSTSKPYSHRIYLDRGIYSDLNYIFKSNTYSVLDWTYPDYQHQEKIEFFNWLRLALLI